MSADALVVVQSLFGTIWSLFTGWYIPGTHTTPASFLIFILFASFALRFIKRIFGGGGDDD